MSTNVRNLDAVAWESGPDRKLAHNTYRVTVDGLPAVRYHGTIIIAQVWDAHGMSVLGYRLDSGGYRTSTTKQRLSALMPGGYGLYQKNFEWFVTLTYGEVVPFEDGMVICG